MNDPSIVGAREGAGNLRTVAHHGARGQARILAEDAQRLALDQLHHDVEFAIGLADFVDGADVGMSERRRSTRFVEQTLAFRGIKTSTLVNNFYGDITVQDFVISAIDNPHSSFPDLGDNPIMTEFLSDHAPNLSRPC